MKIKIIENCFISGKPHRIGDVLEVGDQNARQLIQMERAVPHKDEPKVEAKPQTKPEKGGK